MNSQEFLNPTFLLTMLFFSYEKVKNQHSFNQQLWKAKDQLLTSNTTTTSDSF